MIQDVIATVVKEMNPRDNRKFTFLHGTTDWQNYEVDAMPLPMVILDDLIEAQYSISQNLRISTIYSCFVLIVGKSDLRDSPGARLPNMHLMEEAAKEFCLKLERSPFTFSNSILPPVRNIRASFEYNVFDANTDGIALRFDVELSQLGYDYCLNTNDGLS